MAMCPLDAHSGTLVDLYTAIVVLSKMIIHPVISLKHDEEDYRLGVTFVDGTARDRLDECHYHRR